ncbi:class II aldolase/adducin family protein [Actinomadura sp. KC345]|uniref:class II aldolase/adducin family protein n=1 Tax=Actinomadura sp. KC345 TaxID=2530371 RepID=UPI00104F10FF|nr:class II aldolase/adducin family protein [Actinomadura sp. KC345]TDC46543.1 class II aldolase/adducin family protein [Actinomadura sp. KC345]
MTVTDDVPENLANIPAPPAFPTADEEREHRKRRTAAGYRVLARFGLDEGIAGHITCRDPELTDHFWTAPFGRYFGGILPRDLMLVSGEGKVVEGEGRLNRAAFAIHSEVHDARPDIVGAVHAHGLHGKTFSSLHTTLAPLTQDACAFYGSHSFHEDYTGVVFDPEEGRRIAASLGDGKAVILANHGHLTVGRTVDSAIWWFVTMERSFQSELLARAAGDPVPLDDETARLTAGQVGGEDVGWFAFQPIWERILSEQPDLAG